MDRLIKPLRLLSNSIADGRGKFIRKDSTASVYFKGPGNEDFVCGYCGCVLIQGLPELNIVNCALKCMRCQAFNDSNSIQPFKSRPILLRDTYDVKFPEFSFQGSELWQNKSFSERLIRISNERIESFMNHQDNLPSVLQHYTSYLGMQGIVSNGSLWISDIAYMNDSSELSYGIGLIESYIREKSSNLNESSKELLRRGGIHVTPDNTSEGYYVCCFCSNNDLLSQWRAYGSGGSGYAIGFSLVHLPLSPRLQIRKVIYDKDIQLDLVRNTIDQTLLYFETIATDKTIEELDKMNVLPAFASFLNNHLMEYVFTFKHPSFQEENEVRLIYQFNRHLDLDKIMFRNYNSIPVPYMEMKLSSDNPDLPILPIVTVTHGPSLHPTLTRKSLSLFLEKHNYSHVEILGSQTPLRI